MLHVVEYVLGREGLVVVDLGHKERIETPEVDQLAGGVDLRLVAGLAHVEHGGRVQRMAIFAREQVRGLEQHDGPGIPRHDRPF